MLSSEDPAQPKINTYIYILKIAVCDKDLISKVYKQLKQLNTKNKQHNLKNGQKT